MTTPDPIVDELPAICVKHGLKPRCAEQRLCFRERRRNKHMMHAYMDRTDGRLNETSQRCSVDAQACGAGCCMCAAWRKSDTLLARACATLVFSLLPMHFADGGWTLPRANIADARCITKYSEMRFWIIWMGMG